MSEPELILSNQLERLYEGLRERLFHESHGPFAPRHVVVPTAAMKGWVQKQLADDPRVGVAFGVRFFFLEEAMNRLWRIKGCSHSSRLETALRLQMLLPERDASFALELSDLFHSYLLYGEELVRSWEGGKAGEWQQELWQRLFAEEGGLSHFLRGGDDRSGLPARLHLFGFSTIPPTYLSILIKESVSLYILSPCQMFWEDICSDRERVALRRYHERRGAKEGVLSELDQFLRRSNPLLANLGRIGREFSRQLEDQRLKSEENYGHGSETTLLGRAQADLALLRERDPDAPADRSIEVHAAPSRRREVEVLMSCVRELLQDPCVALCDIHVMAPDIAQYAPYLKALGAHEGIPFHIEAPAEPHRGLAQLFALERSRWSIADLLTLFEFPPLMSRHALCKEDIQTLRRWAEACGVRWGFDASHRDALLARDYGDCEMLDKSFHGTWRRMLSMLLQAVSMAPTAEELLLEERWMPAAVTMNVSDLERLEKLHALLHSLYQDVQTLRPDRVQTLSAWVDHLDALQQRYFFEEEVDRLKCLRSACRTLKDERFAFSHIQAVLEREWRLEGTFSSRAPESSICASSMSLMRALPRKVYVLLGMDEYSFPRSVERSKISRLPRDIPTRADSDRYLFLEILLHTRKALRILYRSSCEEDGQPLSPSLVVSELLRAWPQIPVHQHKAFGFHHSYFAQDNAHSTWHYRLSEALYGVRRQPPSLIIWKRKEEPALPTGELVIAMQALRAFASDPIRTFCNAALGLYLPSENRHPHADSEPVALHPLELSAMAWQALHHPVEQVLRRAEQSAALPLHPFFDLAASRIQHQADELSASLAALGVTPKALQTRSIDGLCVPVTDTLRVRITGCIANVSDRGLVYPGRFDPASLLRAWPLWLGLQCMTGSDQPNALLFARSGKVVRASLDARSHLQRYLLLFLHAQAQPLPLLPEWIEPIRAGDLQMLKAVQARSFSAYVRAVRTPSFAFIQESWERYGKAALEPALTEWEEGA